MIEFFFWASIFLIIYPYSIYPFVMLSIGSLWPRAINLKSIEPTVTVLIPAYNEASCIGATVQNKLVLDYPREKLQVIVVSDGSTDGTDGIVQQFFARGVELIRQEVREGKAAALNAAVKQATGEIIVFSDANSLFAPDAIRCLVQNFADPAIGYVTGSLHYVTNNNSLSGDGVSLYMGSENLLRRIETRAGSVIGVNGGIDAIRRRLYVDIPAQLITDFVLPLTVIAEKHRVIFDPRVRATEMANIEMASEFRMRVRVTLRALQGIAFMRRLLNPFQYPLAFFCLLSHKVIRYLGFVFLALALLLNSWLAQASLFYEVLLFLQLIGYSVALLGLLPKLPTWLRRSMTAPSYLLMTYVAFAMAMYKFVRGDSMAVWKPRAG